MPSVDVASANHKTRHATGGPDAITPADIGALIAHLDDAVAAARTATPPIREMPTVTIPAARVAAGGAFVDLQAALRRRQDALRPTRPTHPLLNAYGPVAQR